MNQVESEFLKELQKRLSILDKQRKAKTSDQKEYLGLTTKCSELFSNQQSDKSSRQFKMSLKDLEKQKAVALKKYRKSHYELHTKWERSKQLFVAKQDSYRGIYWKHQSNVLINLNQFLELFIDNSYNSRQDSVVETEKSVEELPKADPANHEFEFRLYFITDDYLFMKKLLRERGFVNFKRKISISSPKIETVMDFYGELIKKVDLFFIKKTQEILLLTHPENHRFFTESKQKKVEEFLIETILKHRFGLQFIFLNIILYLGKNSEGALGRNPALLSLIVKVVIAHRDVVFVEEIPDLKLAFLVFFMCHMVSLEVLELQDRQDLTSEMKELLALCKANMFRLKILYMKLDSIILII